MKKSIIYYVLVFLSLVTVYHSYNQRKSFEEKLWILQSDLLETRFELTALKEEQSIGLSTNGTILSDSLRHVLPSQTLILRLHNGICLSCYTENILKLKNELAKKGKGLLVLGSYTFDGGLKDEIAAIQDKELKSLNMPALRIMPANSLDRPYVFYVNRQGQIEHLHFFSKKDFSLTSEYLQSTERFLSLPSIKE